MLKYEHELDMDSENSASVILKQIRKGSKVLEFGPATGYMTRYMSQNLECTVYCIELDPQAAEFASKYCEKMIVANLEDLSWSKDLQAEEFDFIIFADVLEHLRNPEEVLKMAVQFLKEDGVAITSIPNIAHNAIKMELLQGNFDYRDLGLLDNTHVNFFTKKSILKMLTEAGLYPVNWMATVVGPEETEFRQAYDQFPENIQNYLLENTEGHVYQYITLSRKKVDGSEIILDQSIRSIEYKYSYLQIYLEKDSCYSGMNSYKQSIEYDGIMRKYTVEVPCDFENFIRIDPGNWSSIIDVKSITLSILNREGEIIPFQISSVDNKFRNLSLGENTICLNKSNVLNIYAFNNDPQLYLKVKEKPDFEFMIVTIEISLSRDLVLLNETLNEMLRAKGALISHLNQDKLGISNLLTNVFKLKSSWKYPLLGKLKSSMENTKGNLLNLIYKIPFFRFKVNLEAIHDIEKIEGKLGHWRVTGNDPTFRIKGKFPSGWVSLKWDSCSDESIPLKMYVDLGKGMSEQNSSIIGRIPKGKYKDYKNVLLISPEVRSLRLDPEEKNNVFEFTNISFRKISRFHLAFYALRDFIKQRGLSVNTVRILLRQFIVLYFTTGIKGIWLKVKGRLGIADNAKFENDYNIWVEEHRITEDRKREILLEIESFAKKPLISIIVPVYNVEEVWLRKCLDSVTSQLYSNWELCIADDASPKPHIKKVLEEYVSKDQRIKVAFRETNGHISESSNSALEIANGEFIGLLDHDDELSQDALYEVIKLLNEHSDADMIYSDEDKISPLGVRHSPFFKPDWSPETLMSQMYTCHLGVYRTSLIQEIGGFRKGFEGSQDYDLVLRFTEKTNKIYHIPKILYHWRSIPQSTASGGSAKSYTDDAGYRALVEAVDRRGLGGWVEPDSEISNLYIVHPKLEGEPLISIIIPTRNMADILDVCLTSVFEKTTYSNYEVIVVDNGSDDPKTLGLFESWQLKEPSRFVVKRIDIPFNYSKLNNLAVSSARGELVLLLNNDIQVITPNWLGEMAAQAMRSEIGAVGACLLYPDNTLQHAGIILGIGGVGGHSHKYFDANDYGYFSRLRMVTNYSAVTAACLMVRKTVYEQVQGLDEKLEVAFNDVDFCLRIRESGYRNVWLPQAKLYHFESKSRGNENTTEKIARFQSEIKYMQERWGSTLLRDPYYNPNLTLDHEDFSLSAY